MEGNNSMGLGFAAAFAVSGSVVLIARQVHKRLLSDFMKKMEFELGYGSSKGSCSEEMMMMKKRVRFAEDVVEPSSNNKEYRKRHLGMEKQIKLEENMPLNRQILYKGIIESRTLKG